APIQQVQSDLPLLLELDVHRDVAFLAPARVVGPVLGEVEPPVQRGVARLSGVGQEDTDLAVVDLAEPAAPLAGYPPGIGPLLGEGAGIDDHDAIGVRKLLADVLPQLGHDCLVIPLARADEKLDRLAWQAGLNGDRLTCFAIQATEMPSDDQSRSRALLDA